MASADYQRERLSKRRVWAIVQLGGKCVSCGSTEQANLEFDHIVPSSKLFTIANGIVGPIDRVITELEKCQLLCRECHVLKSRREVVSRPWTHGTTTGWIHYQCRCDHCSEAHEAWLERRRIARSGKSGRRNLPAGNRPHGSNKRYESAKCRCEACRSAHASAMREYRQSKQAGVLQLG